MYHYDLQLKRGGNLVCMEWSRENERYEERILDSEEIPFHLTSTLCTERGATLRDILRVTGRHPEIFAAVTDCPALQMFVDEAFEDRGEDECCCGSLMALELGWVALADAENGEIVLYEHMNFQGRAHDGDAIGLEFSHVGDLADVPIEIDDTMMVREGSNAENILFSARRPMTLEEVARGIVGELAFFGTPENRAKEAEGLKRAVEEVDSGSAKLYSLEEVMSRIEARADGEKRKFPCRKCGKDSRCACFGKPADICHECFTKMEED